MMKHINNLLAALGVLGVLASSIWVIAGAINTANGAAAMAAEARSIAIEAARKVEGLDVIEEKLSTLKREIDEIQQHQVSTKDKLERKLDRILEQVEK